MPWPRHLSRSRDRADVPTAAALPCALARARRHACRRCWSPPSASPPPWRRACTAGAASARARPSGSSAPIATATAPARSIGARARAAGTSSCARPSGKRRRASGCGAIRRRRWITARCSEHRRPSGARRADHAGAGEPPGRAGERVALLGSGVRPMTGRVAVSRWPRPCSTRRATPRSRQPAAASSRCRAHGTVVLVSATFSRRSTRSRRWSGTMPAPACAAICADARPGRGRPAVRRPGEVRGPREPRASTRSAASKPCARPTARAGGTAGGLQRLTRAAGWTVHHHRTDRPPQTALLALYARHGRPPPAERGMTRPSLRCTASAAAPRARRATLRRGRMTALEAAHAEPRRPRFRGARHAGAAAGAAGDLVAAAGDAAGAAARRASRRSGCCSGSSRARRRRCACRGGCCCCAWCWRRADPRRRAAAAQPAGRAAGRGAARCWSSTTAGRRRRTGRRGIAPCRAADPARRARRAAPVVLVATAPPPLDAPRRCAAARCGPTRRAPSCAPCGRSRGRPTARPRSARSTSCSSTAGAHDVWLSDGLDDERRPGSPSGCARFDGLQVVLPDAADARRCCCCRRPPRAATSRCTALRPAADGAAPVAVQASDDAGPRRGPHRARLRRRGDQGRRRAAGADRVAQPHGPPRHRGAGRRGQPPCCSTNATAAGRSPSWASAPNAAGQPLLQELYLPRTRARSLRQPRHRRPRDGAEARAPPCC